MRSYDKFGMDPQVACASASAADGPASGDARPVLADEPRHRSAVALSWIAAVMRAAARGVRAAATSLDGWLERRRVAAAALRDLETMSERELLDIGLTRVDVRRVAWGASNRI